MTDWQACFLCIPKDTRFTTSETLSNHGNEYDKVTCLCGWTDLYLYIPLRYHLYEHLYLGESTARPSFVLCCDIAWDTLLNLPIGSLLFLFIFFSMFFVLIHDYTLCFTGSPYCKFSYCKFSYYNYISLWPYYIVIHLLLWQRTQIS